MLSLLDTRGGASSKHEAWEGLTAWPLHLRRPLALRLGLPTGRGSNSRYSRACCSHNSCCAAKDRTGTEMQECRERARPPHPPRAAALSHMAPGTWQPSGPWRLHPLPRGLRAAAAVCVHSVTWAAGRGQATTCHYSPGRCQLQALLPRVLSAVGTLMFQQMAADGQSYTETWGVTEAEGGRLKGRVLGPAEPATQPRWRGLCVHSSAPLEGALCPIEGILCPQLSTDGEGSVSLADSQRLTPAPTSFASSYPVQALPGGCFPPEEATTNPPRNSLLTVALPQLKISLQCVQTYLAKKICLEGEEI